MSLVFDDKKYEVRTMEAAGSSVTFRAYEGICTVMNPSERECQSINIYVPECFYDGSQVNGYSLKNAPIFFEVDMGGFFTSMPKKPEDLRFRRTSIFFYCLQHGYVVVAAGCRGRMSRDEKGNFCGKLPAAIADCKMAIKYLHYNRERVPGDVEKIIVSGTSAGGGVAVHMGLYGSDDCYKKEFEKHGAADASSRVYAVAAYCPVTDLEHVDMAYEWQFDGIYDYHRMAMNMDEGGRPQFTKEDGMLSNERQTISRELAALFPSYVNSFNLLSPDGEKLSLDSNGNGSFKGWLLGQIPSADNFQRFMEQITRMKLAPAFDDITMDSFENNAFGDEKTDFAHFTDYSFTHSTCSHPIMASSESRFLANPHNFIGENMEMADRFRIRQGSKDRDIGMATVALLALHLQNAGAAVEYGIDLDEVHGGDYDPDALLAWIDRQVGRNCQEPS